MPELLVLGSSAGIPTANRHTTSMALKMNDRLYLLDCGGPVSTALKAMGEDPRRIEAVFISHWHPDHTGGLPMLIQDLQLTRHTKKLTIFGPEGSHRKIRQLQNIFLIPPEVCPFEIQIVDLEPGTFFRDDDIQIDFYRTNHMVTPEWEALDHKYNNELRPIAYGMEVRYRDKKLVYSGDMRTSEDLLPALDGADVVVHEFGHIKPDVLAQFAREHSIRKLIVTHIHHAWDGRGDELAEYIARDYAGDLVVACDLQRISI